MAFFPPDLSSGLSYRDRYLSEGAAAALIEGIDANPWQTDLSRRVQHYGYRYDYKARRVGPADRIGPLPEPFEDLADQLVECGYFQAKPDQVIVNEYLPGQGISPHIDCAPCFGEVIASVGLLSSCVMRFEKGAERWDLVLQPLSLLVMRAEARWSWTHAIPARKNDMIDGGRVPRARRISLTFRTMRLND